MDQRSFALEQWLKDQCGFADFRLEAMIGDASFRRYFRLYHANQTYVVMDAPPPHEHCEPFIRIAKTLRQEGLQAPEIFHADDIKGFLVLTDFGDQKMLNTLNKTNAEILYKEAILTLVQLQKIQISDQRIPFFTAERMMEELLLFKEWFLHRFLEVSLTTDAERSLQYIFQILCDEATRQPQVFMHRDYHSANLMVLPHNKIAILDFQDAFVGPLLYDLVSLLRDCYIDWPDTFVTQLAFMFRDRLSSPIDKDLFLRWFDLMGLERHLKALLTFSRKYIRDFNNQYLQYIPRTLNYIYTISGRYSECQFLHKLCEDEIIPNFQKKVMLCVP